jgi:hypothetical protein
MQSEFELLPSKIAIALISSIILINIIIILTLPVFALVKLLLMCLVAAYSVYVWKQLQQTSGIRGDKWLIRQRDKVDEGVLRGDSTVTPFVSVLRFSMPGKFLATSCVVFMDSLSKDAYRQLRVIVRMY